MSQPNYGSLGTRATAVIIDLAVWFGIGYSIAVMTGATTGWGFGLAPGPGLGWILTYFGYYTVFEAHFGRTIGKMVVGLSVVSESISPIGYRASAMRNALRLIDGLLFYAIGAILVTRSARNQRLGDRVAETIVIRD